MKRMVFVIFLLSGLAVSAQSNDSVIKAAYLKSYNYEKMQNYPDAIKALLPVYEQFPKGYTVNIRLAWLYYLNANYANSIEHYETALESTPYSLEAKVGRLLPLLAQGKYDQVEEEAFNIMNVDYYNYYANLRLLVALRLQQKYDVAEKIAIKMLTVYPIDVSFLTEYALIKQAMGEIDQAAKTFADILILDPENITAGRFFTNNK